jgi:two-component system phosphate regulon response regulator PhoB
MLDAPEGSAAYQGASAATSHGPGSLRRHGLRPTEGRTSAPRPYHVLEGGNERTILVAEDDHSCRSALHHYFERSGYRVTEAADGPSSLRAVFQHSADLVILDLGLPGVDGPEVLAKIRRHSAVPVIVCSGRDSEEERIRMLNLGADDFVVKPFSFAELEARVRAVLRRGNNEPTVTRMEHGGLLVDRDTRTVAIDGEPIPMTRKEFDLLAFLAASPGQVFSREDLLERVWGSTEQWQGRSTVTEHVRRVRLKIEPDPDAPRWILTVRGVGYRFFVPED